MITSGTYFPALAALADATANPTTSLFGEAAHVFNGTTWDRLRSYAAAASTTGTTGVLGVVPMTWTGGTGWGLPWASVSDALGGNTLMGAGNFIYNGATWDRLRSALGANTGTIAQAGDSLVVSGTGAALNAIPIAATDVRAYRWVSVQLTGTWVGSIQFQSSNDNATWIGQYLEGGGAPTQFASANGIWSGLVQGRYFRIVMNGYTSGTVTATALFTAQTGAFPVTGVGAYDPTAFSQNLASSSMADAQASNSYLGVQGVLYNGATWDRARSATAADATSGTGIPASGLLGWDASSSVYRRVAAVVPPSPNIAVVPTGDVPQAPLLSGSMTVAANTAYQTLTLTSMQAISTSALLSAREALLVISQGASGQPLPEIILRFTDTVGGQSYNLDYTVTPALTTGTTPGGPALAASGVMAIPIPLAQGVLRTCQIIFRYSTAPTAVTLTAQVTLQSTPAPPGTIRLDSGGTTNTSGVQTSSPPTRLTLTASRIGPWFWTGNIKSIGIQATVPTTVTGTSPTLSLSVQGLINGVNAVSLFSTPTWTPVSLDTHNFVYGESGIATPTAPKSVAQGAGVGSVNGMLGEWTRIIWSVGGTTPSIPFEYTVFGYTV